MKIIITEPFERKLKKLKKKYPNIKNDLKELLSNLEEGKASGVPIPGLFNKVFKIRFGSSDMERGKSGGYRLIFYIERDNCEIYLLTIYAKAKNENIPVKDIQSILKELDLKFKKPDPDLYKRE
ncbi:MAG: type II toxin-antitoxin system RelE/ParE family toxin [Desulfobacterales bacterium]|nr:type II toxin-antitoxin system RelE/ParE family toxin [Desulfobacterales bacterium]